MGDMPDPFDVLTAISQTERTDAESKFIASEARVAVYALMHGR